MSYLEKDKYYCKTCEVVLKIDKLLKGKHPFNLTQEVTGCPNCFSIDSFYPVCDEPGCTETASCGVTTIEGYRSLCGTHILKEWG